MHSFKVLDCTFRDGGYYNNWHFPASIIQKQLTTAPKIGVDFVEIGFRFLENNKNYGPSSTCESDFIQSFEVPEKIGLAVMFNASDLIKSQIDQSTFKTFLGEYSPKLTNLHLVRIACHYHEFKNLKPSLEYLKHIGCTIALNLMQISKRSEQEIVNFLNFCNQNSIDIVYFADSLGSLFPNDTKHISKIFHNETNLPFGIHAHDNLGLSLINSLTALENGATFIDASITGMGRGPGNTILEEILQIKNNDQPEINYDELLNLIEDYFLPLKEQNKWGKNPLYFSAGLNSVHPTYVQEISTLHNLRLNKKFDLVNKISSTMSKSSFKKDLIWNELLKEENETDAGTNNSNLNFAGKTVIILGPNSFTSDNLYELKIFAKNNASIIVLPNPNKEMIENSEVEINFGAFASPLRWNDRFNNLNIPLISPFRSLIDDHYFNLNISNKIELDQHQISLPKPTVIPYLIGFLSLRLSKNLILHGFDNLNLHNDFTVINNCVEEVKKHFPTKIFLMSNTENIENTCFNFIRFYNKIT